MQFIGAAVYVHAWSYTTKYHSKDQIAAHAAAGYQLIAASTPYGWPKGAQYTWPAIETDLVLCSGGPGFNPPGEQSIAFVGSVQICN